jgi:uncharacterized protein YlxW (UPF0749 family)
MNLKNIFKNSTPSNNDLEKIKLNNKNDLNTDSKIDWKQRGVNAAGLAQGRVVSYEPNLSAEVQAMKEQQSKNLKKQEEWREERLNKKNVCETEVITKQNLLEAEIEKIQDKEQQILSLKSEKNKLATENKTNKNALVNFIIALVIILGMTIYLFIFYSSTAYSAFFKQFGLDNTEIVSEMFDSQALTNARNDGFTELLFVLLIPTIFLGLGYLLHQFSTKIATNNIRIATINILKITALYFITFIFDCLLAYKISASMYEVKAAGMLEELPQYTLSMASGNVDFWIVIFCGFIAYVIWGLVFSFLMNNYEQLHKHTSQISAIDSKITELQEQIAKLKTNLTTLKNDIEKLKGEIKKIDNSLAHGFVIDWGEIKTSLSAFNQGWIAFMTLQNMPSSEIDEVKHIYDRFISEIDRN